MSKQQTDIFLELHVPDFQKALVFYKILGFEVVRTEVDYLVIKRGQSVINFFGGNKSVENHSYFGTYPSGTKRGCGVEIIIPVNDIENYYDSIKDKVTVVTPLKLRRWGKRDFRINDPFGFYLRITERYDMFT